MINSYTSSTRLLRENLIFSDLNQACLWCFVKSHCIKACQPNVLPLLQLNSISFEI